MLTPAALTLPWPMRQLADDRLRALLSSPALPAVDFTAPAGEPALAPPEAFAWRLFKNPLIVLVGGTAAVLLELAEPRIRDGLWVRTSFRRDPLRRLQRTGLAAMVTVYGPRSTAERMIAGVNRLHAGISGTTADGRAYRADDPELLDWVHATASFGMFEAYAAYLRPLARAERDRAYREALPAAALYGAYGAPASEAECRAIFDRRRAALAPSPAILSFLRIMRGVPALPGPARLLQPLLVKASVSLLPPWLRARLGIESWTLAPWERPAVRAAALAADRLILPASPAVQSCRRLGLPDDYLYRR